MVKALSGEDPCCAAMPQRQSPLSPTMLRALVKALSGNIHMLKFITSSDAAHGASVALVIVTAGLLGQYAARGISPSQWVFGLTAIAGSIAVAVMLRCWPAPQADDRVTARD